MLRLAIILFLIPVTAVAQSVSGRITSSSMPVPFAAVSCGNSVTIADSSGNFLLILPAPGACTLRVNATGYFPQERSVTAAPDSTVKLEISLQSRNRQLNEVVISGTLKEVHTTESAINIEVYTPAFFRKNPTPNLFEALQSVNGVRPQINCNVCNTGDIHINGMEGPYTMVTIDGMPIVSSLASVYGLMGIPNGIIERIEVVKGPASTLYGSEAMGGLINIITKNPLTAPIVSADVFGTGYSEYNVDLAAKLKLGKTMVLGGINYFNMLMPWDKNKDGFTDISLQHRISAFNKWSFGRKSNRLFTMAARYIYEDRWGGQVSWTPEFRGSDSIYGESIYTNRVEMIGQYQLPFKELIMLQFSYNYHDQDSWYGTNPYMATQHVGFVQAYWDRKFGREKPHQLMAGMALRYTFYDDNTPGTALADSTNSPQNTWLPGIFIQDEWTFHPRHKLLGGIRLDYSLVHGPVLSPRLNYKWSPHRNHIFRLGFGNGYRVVNLFTEDHAALTGARKVVITEDLQPERSYNGNAGYQLFLSHRKGYANIDLTGFYSYFTNKITGDFDTDPNLIIFDNLEGHAVSAGISLNTELAFDFGLKLLAGATWMNVYQEEPDSTGTLIRSRQLHAPEWSGTFALSYTHQKTGLTADFTGQWSGPMRLPVLPQDYRPEYSPWFCTANIQLTKKFGNGLELYAGIKNIFDFMPKNPIMRPEDPFNQHADDPVNNPNGYIFDPSYNYAAVQGIRVFYGVRYSLFAK